MDELQKGFEIAGTGIGVVFAALVSLAVVTALLGKALMRGEAEPEAETATPAPTAADADADAASAPADSSTDPAMVAAMVAAVQFVRRGLAPSTAPAARRQSPEMAGAWRAQGRQSLMASQGVRVRPRSDRR